MSKEVVIRIKISDDLPDDLKSLVEILTEASKPDWRTRLPGWRSGQRSLSERAIALMLEAVRSKADAPAPAAKVEIKRASASSANRDEEDNPFG